ncbi:Lanosterol synthase [Frankliniella fusca]|uniref:Lanosterol synthase n=1 Tax=Frankliniella fusca TaxID=407009 RepID=A0AAE1LPT2_9NEOP|nr:Lanosterol synthase [Frankliniella fusca]
MGPYWRKETYLRQRLQGVQEGHPVAIRRRFRLW